MKIYLKNYIDRKVALCYNIIKLNLKLSTQALSESYTETIPKKFYGQPIILNESQGWNFDCDKTFLLQHMGHQ